MLESGSTLENSGERSQVKKIFKRVAVVECVCARERVSACVNVKEREREREVGVIKGREREGGSNYASV